MGQESGIAVSCSVGHRSSSDPMLLWLWHSLAAAALIRPLAWKLPYALGAALKKKIIQVQIDIPGVAQRVKNPT